MKKKIRNKEDRFSNFPLGFEHTKTIDKNRIHKENQLFFYVKRCSGEVRFTAFYKHISRL